MGIRADTKDALDLRGHLYHRERQNDEEAYRYVQRRGRVIREAESIVKVLVVEQTWTQNEAWGELYGTFDVWCPLFPLFKAESAAKRQALGETVWTYTALCRREKTPWWHIDFPLLDYRVPAWIAWRYRIRGLLYWGGMSFRRQVEDPWTDPKTLDRRDGRKDLLYNGEGSIVYPGRAVGYDGIAASLRLKALRDSIEDYEYLAILEGLGSATGAEAVVVGLAPSWFNWETSPTAYEEARARLATRIVTAPGGALAIELARAGGKRSRHNTPRVGGPLNSLGGQRGGRQVGQESENSSYREAVSVLQNGGRRAILGPKCMAQAPLKGGSG